MGCVSLLSLIHVTPSILLIIIFIVDLDHKYFNHPLRRDIITKVFHYFAVKGVKRIKTAKTVGDVRGSGKKPAPQKSRGVARVGNKRRPQNKKGGAALVPKKQDLTEKCNAKLRLKAIYCALSAKLFEDRIVIIDSEVIETHKTKVLNEILAPYMSDRLTFLTPFDANPAFGLACRNLRNVTVKNP